VFESNPDLAGFLREQGVGEIISFGLQSDYCVQTACKGAITAGFPVTILSGAHSTYDSDGKTASQIEAEVEEMLRGAGARVVKWEDAISDWAERFN
jgi:nicotinamidase-related amidase